MGGGRSAPQQSVTTSGIDEEFKPYLEEVLADVTQRYKDTRGDPDSIVAGMTQAQKDALAAQESLSRETMAGDPAKKEMYSRALAGTGEYDYTAARNRDLQNVMGSASGQAAMSGALGSARAEKAMQGALADRSMQFQQQRQADVMSGLGMKDQYIAGKAAGIKGLGDVGSARQQYAQQRLDAPDTAAARYFGYLGSAPQKQTQTTTGGGGK
jgi:phosphoglycerate dehydrogenase-like enzyme